MTTLFKTTLLAAAATPSFAQSADAEGCKDHPLLNRMSKYYIQECTNNYNEKEFVTGDNKTVTHEGDVTTLLYTYDGPYGPNLPSKLQIIRNYENAIVAQGGKKLYSKASGGDWTGGTFQFAKDGKEYWVAVHDLINDPVDQFSVTILSKEAMTQEIKASAMFDKINTGGSLVLYINFETGKSAIKSESQNIVNELHAMLSGNPGLKILIEGHTDNAGNGAANQTLSEQRAASVKQALVQKGIAADRIKTVGYGQDKPLADNATEEGRAKNRRVEVRKL